MAEPGQPKILYFHNKLGRTYQWGLLETNLPHDAKDMIYLKIKKT